MVRLVNMVARTLLVVSLLLAQQPDCVQAADQSMAEHVHGAGATCHDDGVPQAPGHEHDDNNTPASQCPPSHGCPTVTGIDPVPLRTSPDPTVVEAPHTPSRLLTSVTLPPDRRPPKH